MEDETIKQNIAPQSTTEFYTLLNKDSFLQGINIAGTSAATSGNYGIILTARNIALEIVGVLERHEVKGTDVGAVTLDVVKVPTGTAISAGTTILASTFDLKGTINTAVIKNGKLLSNVPKSRYLKPSESLALKTSGALTDVAGVHITVYYKPINAGSYRI